MCLGRRPAHGCAMNITTAPTSLTTHDTVKRPGRGRRAALVGASVLTCALPLMWTANITRMLLTGVESEHRFHQATGQGLILFAFWLGALIPLIRSGWRGERPSTTAGLRHLTLLLGGVVCAAVAPGGGAPALLVVIAVGGGVLWWALPVRPRLRSEVQVDPVLLPASLVLAACLLPYAADQLSLQNAATGYHSHNPHFFDMAWISVVLVAQALLAALLPAARSLALPVGVATVALGTAGLAFGEATGQSWIAVVVGLVVAGAHLVSARR